MRSFFTNKFWILFISVLALGALIGLAIGLKDISFRSGQAFGRNDARPTQSPPGGLVNAMMSIPLQKQIGFWILVTFMFVLLGMLMSGEMGKRVFGVLFR